MLISTTSPAQIRNHPSNTSPSKQQWTFSKANRFICPKSNCQQSFYNKGSCLSERKASIGIGQRCKYFQGNQDMPEPSRYYIKSNFDNKSDKNNKKGFSFSANRDKVRFDNYLNYNKNSPNSTSYTIDFSQVRGIKRYTMRPKTAYPNNYFLPNENEVISLQNLPGPGNYKTIDSLGTNYRTKSPNHFAQAFTWGDRFKQRKSVTPGPQDYQNKAIQPDGIYLLSNMKGSGRRSFLLGKKNTTIESKTDSPGPGSYRLPSDFGHYQDIQHKQPDSIAKTLSTKL